MKKRYSLFLAAAILAVASCNKEQIADPDNTPDTPAIDIEKAEVLESVFFTVSSEESKSYIEGNSIKWVGGETIGVHDGKAVREFTVSVENGTVTISGEVAAESSTLYAAYPYSAEMSVANDKITAELPNTQTISDKNVADGALMVVAKFEKDDSKILLKTVPALLKVAIPEGMTNVKSIIVDGTGICGSVNVNPESGVIDGNGASDSVTISANEGFLNPGTYYLAVLPGTYPAGDVKVRLCCESSGWVQAASVSTKEVTLARSTSYNFVSAAPSMKWERHISSVDQLLEWNNLPSGFNSYPVYLDDDIDMSGKSWTPKGLTTTFDGQGHKVYNIVRTQSTNIGFFANLSGKAEVRNLVLGSSDGESYDGVSCFTISNSTIASSFTYAGGIVGYINGPSTIENCKNFAKVVSDSDNVTKVRLGGIAGGSNNYASTITNCENAGEVVAYTGTLSASSNIGGIMGWSDGAVTFENTNNRGYIHTNNKDINRLTGILGGTSTAVVLDNCDNSGAVKYETANNKEVFIAGIVGDIDNAQAVVKNCDNTGAVTIEDKTAKSSALVEIAGVCAKLVLAKEFSNNTNAAAITNTVINSVDNEASGIIIGGIVANVAPATGTSVTISDCKTLNASNVVDNFSFNTDVDPKYATRYIKEGGIAGQVTGNATFKNCNNAGVVQKITTDFGTAYLGGIIGFINTGSDVTVNSCNNSRWIGTNKNALGTKDLSTSKGGNIFIGGICGSMKGVASFTGCTNTGGIGQTGEIDKIYGSYVYIGGIVGNVTNVVNVNGCTNSGEIKNIGKVLSWNGSSWTNTANGLRMGGIIGALNAGSGNTGTISGCTNTGTVTNECTLAKAAQELGGILGYCSGGNAVVNDCVSNATIKSLNATLANIYSGELIGYIPFNNVTANNNHIAGKLIKTGGAETVITSGNWSSCIWTLVSGKTVTTTTPNGFYTGSSPASIVSLSQSTDSNLW